MQNKNPQREEEKSQRRQPSQNEDRGRNIDSEKDIDGNRKPETIKTPGTPRVRFEEDNRDGQRENNDKENPNYKQVS